MRIVTCFFICAFLILGSALSAGPITWNLTNIVFGDGTTVTGSFVFDADTTTFSGLNMTTAGGISVPETSSWVFNTNDVDTGEQNSGTFTGFAVVTALSANETGTPAIFLFSNLGPLMTDAGGTITLNHMAVGSCGSATCQTIAIILGSNGGDGSGQFTSVAAVPEPASMFLVGLGLAGAFALRLRRQPSTQPASQPGVGEA
jgi:hypothetical protein